MKINIYITLICLGFSFIGKTQTTLFDSVYFNDLGQLNNETEYILGISTFDNFTFATISGTNFSTGKRNSFIVKIDSVGNKVNRFSFNNTGEFIHNSSGVCNSLTKVFVTGTLLNTAVPDSGKLFISIFSKELDSLDFKVYEFSQNTGVVSQLLYDGNKYIYGSGYCDVDASTYGDLFVVKFDTLGNLIWKSRYGLTTRNEGSGTLQLIGNDSLFVSGPSNEGSNGASGLAVLLDTAGTELWRRYIDIPGKENTFAGGFIYKDGGFIMPGTCYTPPNGESDLCITKLSASGIRQWDKIYSLGASSEGTDYCFYNQEDSTIIAVGGNLNVPQFHEAGLAIKYTMEGDTMWTRTYDKSYNLNGYIDHFYKGIATNDGGYLFAGQTSSGIIAGKQDAWLLKTDSIGCHPNYPCWPATHYNYTSLKSNAYSSFNSSVFPNPATNYVCVKFKNINQNNACTLKLYNITGQLIKQQTFNYVNPIALFNIEDVEQGMYVLEVETLYGTERTKIIKE